MSQNLIISEENISSKIYFIRNQKVMLDRDLAMLYNVETRVLKQSVRRNISRFPQILCLNYLKKNLKIGNHNL